MPNLKVFSLNWCGQTERLVAASSAAQAARCLGVSAHEFRNYGGPTSNAESVRVALANPAVVFERPFTSTGVVPWSPAYPAPKVGVGFLHRRRVDPNQPGQPLLCTVTAASNDGTIYYGPAGYSRGDECTSAARWATLAAFIPPA